MKRWAPLPKLAIVVETAILSEHELGRYCGDPGLPPEQLAGKQQLIKALDAQTLWRGEYLNLPAS